ncbi:GCD complex subunit gcd7, partial [Cladochytrium tenue]
MATIANQVNSLAEKLRRRQIVGPLRCSLETAKVLIIVVRGSRWATPDQLIKIVKEKGRQLVEAQPIELSVGNVVRRVLHLIREEVYSLEHADDKAADTGDAQEWRDTLRGNFVDAIKEMIDEYENASSNIAGQALDYIHSNEIIMTLGHSDGVERFLVEAAKLRKFQVIAGIDTTLVTDSAIFAVMSRVNKVILGTHAVLANGGLVAISGSQVVAAAAKYHSTPVVVLSELYKLSPVYPFDVDEFGLQLSPDPVYGFEDGDVMDKVDILNPSFDVVSPNLVNLFVTN